MKIKLFALALPALMSLACSTSTEFQAGAAALGPRVAARATIYAGADASKLGQAAQLKADTSVTKDISLSVVSADWALIEPWFRAAANAEPATQPAEQLEKANHVGMADDFDALIAADKSRPVHLFGK